MVTFHIRVGWRQHLALYSSHARLNDSGSTGGGAALIGTVVKLYDVAAVVR